MISAVQFLAVLEEKDLLPQEILFKLYKQVAHSQNALTAADISQMLIDQGYLTPALANRLMGWNVEPVSQKESATGDSSSGSRVNLQGKSVADGSTAPMKTRTTSPVSGNKEEQEENQEKTEREEDIGFAPIKEEREPRPMLGKHRAYKTGDSSKTSPAVPSAPNVAKPVEPPPPKSVFLDKPPPSKWASSVYDREVDSSKGIVSPQLVKLAGTEKIPEKIIIRKRTRWLAIFIRGSLILGFLVLLYILIAMIFM